jgi:hypothetical protein
MLAEFTKLYETGEFQLGYCLADVQVNETGTVDTVRVLRPQNVDERVESVIVRSMKSRRYKPATACGRPVPFKCQSAWAIAHLKRNVSASRIASTLSGTARSGVDATGILTSWNHMPAWLRQIERLPGGCVGQRDGPGDLP